MEENKPIQSFVPTNDYVFKRIFGYKGNEEITKELLNAILDENIKKIEFNGNKILEKDLKDDKVGILDIRATLNNDIECDIEMQVSNRKDIEKRILFYWSKMYLEGIKESEKYKNLKKTIIILISNYEIENLRKIEKFHTKWQIREKEYTKRILTEVMEINIIEIPKLEKVARSVNTIKEKTLEKWIKFIKEPEKMGESEMKDIKGIKEAKKVYDEIRDDEHERWLAEQRMIRILDERAIEDYGYDKGMKEGIIKIAKEMLKKHMDINTICELTGLSKEEIEKLK